MPVFFPERGVRHAADRHRPSTAYPRCPVCRMFHATPVQHHLLSWEDAHRSSPGCKQAGWIRADLHEQQERAAHRRACFQENG